MWSVITDIKKLFENLCFMYHDWNNCFIENSSQPALFAKTTDFQLSFNFKQTRTVTIFGEYGIMGFSKYTLSDLGDLSNLIGSLSWTI